jgi:hypothetical protein
MGVEMKQAIRLLFASIIAYLVVDWTLPPGIFVLFGDTVAAQTTQSGNPSPGPIGVIGANVAVCDPYNPQNCLTPAATTLVNASGTTGVVSAGMGNVVGKTNYICGVEVDAVGSATGSVSPMTLAGVLGGTISYPGFQALVAPGATFIRNYNPCLPASGPNTSIAFATTADATGTAITVILWGFTH